MKKGVFNVEENGLLDDLRFNVVDDDEDFSFEASGWQDVPPFQLYGRYSDYFSFKPIGDTVVALIQEKPFDYEVEQKVDLDLRAWRRG